MDGSPFPRSGLFAEIIDRILADNLRLYGDESAGNAWTSRTQVRPVQAARLFREVIQPYVASGRIRLYSNYYPVFVTLLGDGKTVEVVRFQSTVPGEPELAVRAKLTIDASDWGDVIQAAGADFEVGVDPHSRYGEPNAPVDLAAYTWSKCMSGPSDRGGMIEGGSFIGEPQDLYNFAGDASVCGFDVSHRLAGSIIYSIPGFRYYPGVLRPLLEGWRLGAIPTLSSGLPAPIDYGLDTTATGVPSRPDRLMRDAVNLPRSERTFQRWFDTSAFVPAQFGSFGNSPRTGAIRLPGTINADVSLTKAFSLPEPGSMEFRVEIFNVFSRFNPSPASVDRNVLSASFGTVGGGVQGVATRVVQFAVKVHLR